MNTIAPIAATAGLAANINSIPGGDSNPLRPEYVSPLVVLLGSSQAQSLATGGLFELAGGWHSRTVLQRSTGAQAGGTIEELLADWPHVLSFNPGPLQSVPTTPKVLLQSTEGQKGRKWERPTFRYDDRDIILYSEPCPPQTLSTASSPEPRTDILSQIFLSAPKEPTSISSTRSCLHSDLCRLSV